MRGPVLREHVNLAERTVPDAEVSTMFVQAMLLGVVFEKAIDAGYYVRFPDLDHTFWVNRKRAVCAAFLYLGLPLPTIGP